MFIIFLFLFPIIVFAEVKPPVIIDDFTESTNYFVTNTHFLISNEIKETHFVIQPFLYKIENNIYLKVKIYTNKILIRDEEVYVKIPLSESKWNNLIKDLVLRITNETDMPYISSEDKELREKINSFDDDELINLLKEYNKFKSLQLLSIFNFGYSYPLNLEISFISIFKTWNFSEIFSFGLGTKIIKIYPLLPYETNSALTLLPIEICVPLIINQNSRFNDLMLSLEWGWYKNTTTNTIKYNEDLTYIDLSIKYILPYSILKTGVNYNYLRNNLLFYVGADIYIGRYEKE
ncbi:MAG: hypothetical protein N2258_04170 [Brevinematales bacterium]|nr:hypothetical protein [Brevinematales bacterium]